MILVNYSVFFILQVFHQYLYALGELCTEKLFSNPAFLLRIQNLLSLYYHLKTVGKSFPRTRIRQKKRRQRVEDY
jgi:hypothetical protein